MSETTDLSKSTGKVEFFDYSMVTRKIVDRKGRNNEENEERVDFWIRIKFAQSTFGLRPPLKPGVAN